MSGHARRAPARLGWLVIAFIVFVLVADGGVSRAGALDRWAGTALFTLPGGILPIDFTVLADPGGGASWEWRLGAEILASGPLVATVSGSTVSGALIVTGGTVFEPPFCCIPCNFVGSIAGNRVDGTFDAISCGAAGTFTLVRQ